MTSSSLVGKRPNSFLEKMSLSSFQILYAPPLEGMRVSDLTSLPNLLSMPATRPVARGK